MMGKMKVIITSPSLNTKENVSGISSATQFIIDNNVEVEYIHFELGKKDSEKGGWRRVSALLRRYKAWRRLLKAEPDALVHYNFPLSKLSLLRDPWFIRCVLKGGRRMIVHVHGGLFLTATNTPWLLKKIMRWVFKQNVPFVVLSDMEKDILQERFGARRVFVLPNCVDLKDAKAYALEQEKAGKSLDAISDNNKPLRIGYLGRIEPNKGMTELLEAAVRLKGDGVPFQLAFAGKEQKENEYLPLYESRLGNTFQYAGLVSGQSKRDFLRSLDVFILPSYFEGLPVALLETMSYGAVPVTTPVGSIPEIVAEDENGIFVKVKDSASIVSAVRKLCADRSMLQRLSENARNTIFSRFSAEKYVQTLNSIYNTDI